MIIILKNPKSCNNASGAAVDKFVAENLKEGEYTIYDVTTGLNYKEIFANLKENDEIYLFGGDGTLNFFVNDVHDIDIKNKIYFYPTGTGNDFINDVKKTPDEEIVRVPLNDYIKDLPYVIVNDEKRYFINDVGFGIDGYCCEEGDRLAALHPDKKVNYTSIAIKGLLFKYKTPNAKVTIDDAEPLTFKRVWLAPTMKGRYYGGGMMVAPMQDRNLKGDLTFVVWSKSGKLSTLMKFSKIFTGEHVKYKKFLFASKVKHHILVEFDKPTALQIDGETRSNITKYEVFYEGK